MKSVLTICSCVLLSVTTGCAVGVVPALSASSETVSVPTASESKWPSRLGVSNGVIVEDTRPITNWRAARVPNGKQLTPYEIETQQYDEFAEKTSIDLAPSYEIGGGFVVIPYIDDGKPADGKQHLVFISAVPSEAGDEASIQRTWFTYDQPDAVEPIGLAVLMPGVFATPRDVSDRAERGLLMRGWAVLRMLSPPSRMTEHTKYTIAPTRNRDVVVQIAMDFDNRIAEAAYAVRAAANHVFESNHALGERPRIIIGMSGTAIALPTVVAFEPEAYDAAVLIGGGVNSFEIAQRSSYRDMIDAVHIMEMPTKYDSIESLSQRYIRHSKLDPFHTAAAMAGIPALLLHGSKDTAVPADTGDQLWELLGKPERWAMPVGHELLFGAVPFRLPAILDWLEDNTGQSGTE